MGTRDAGRDLLSTWFAMSLLVAACGGQGSTSATMSTGCPAGLTYCAGCQGSGFCSNGCPQIACPASTADGGADGASAQSSDGGVCPSNAPTTCVDCSGNAFCLSAGPCPSPRCPVADDGGGEASLNPPPACPAAPPGDSTPCSQPQGCTFGSACTFCAPTAIGGSCASSNCIWGSMQLTPNGSGCPSMPPTNAAACTSAMSCYYCEPDGLWIALCESMNGTFSWNAFLQYHPQPGI